MVLVRNIHRFDVEIRYRALILSTLQLTQTSTLSPPLLQDNLHEKE